MVWGLAQRRAAPTAGWRGARLWWWGLWQRGAAPTAERRGLGFLWGGPFAAGALLLQKLSTSRFICRSSAPAANGAQRAPAGCNRSPARRGLWKVEHTASSPAWTIIPDGHDKRI